MQMVKKSIAIAVSIWLAMLIFMPKEELYHTLEKRLATQDITLNETSVEEGIFTLNIKDVTVFVKGIALAHIEELNLFTVLVYNRLQIKNLNVDEALHSKVPEVTQEANFVYHILSPLSASMDANGSFGTVEGTASLANKSIHIDFIEAKKIEMLKPFLHDADKGWFYEKSF